MVRLSLLWAGMLVAGLLSRPVTAEITAYSDDFNGLTQPGTFGPWVAFSDNGGFPGGYFIPAVSTAGPQIAALANVGGTDQYLNFYANYDNAPVHNRFTPGQNPTSPNAQEAISFFIEQTFTGADTASGATWYFDFDYAANPQAPITDGPNTTTQTAAFIRVFNASFNLLSEITFDTRPATDAFQTGSLSVTLDPAWVNGRIQFGFTNVVGEYAGSGRFYDNVRIANTPSAIPEPGSLALLSLGVLGFVGRRYRRRHS